MSYGTKQSRSIQQPVSSGSYKITLMLGTTAKVADARFHVVEFRGFEVLRRAQFLEMPRHYCTRLRHLPGQPHSGVGQAATRSLGVRIPRAEKLPADELGAVGAKSHAGFFHLSAPDLLLGMDSLIPPTRNIMGLIQTNPSVAAAASASRRLAGGDPSCSGLKRPSSPGR